jgi:hypothetical protein
VERVREVMFSLSTPAATEQSNYLPIFSENLKMKTLHIILAALNVISIILLIQIVFGWIPSIESNYSIDQMDKINNLIVDLSIGVITSTLFYIMLVYLPDEKKAKTAREVNSINLRYLAENMQFMIIHIAIKNNIKLLKDDYNYSQIVPTEFYKINSNIFSKSSISENYKIFLRIKGMPDNPIGFNKIDLKEIRTDTLKLIERILSSPSIIFEDENLIKLLNKISNCTLYKTMILIDFIYPKSLPDYGSQAKEYYELYLDILKYTTPHCFYFKKTTKKVLDNKQLPLLKISKPKD